MKLDKILSEHFNNIKIFDESFEIQYTYSFNGFNIETYAINLPGKLFNTWINTFGDNIITRPEFSQWLIKQEIDNKELYLKLL